MRVSATVSSTITKTWMICLCLCPCLCQCARKIAGTVASSGDCMRASLTVVRSVINSSVMFGKDSFCLIRMAISQVNVSQGTLICGSRDEFFLSRRMNHSQYLMTEVSVPILIRIHAHLAASTPSCIITDPRTSQSSGSLATSWCVLSSAIFRPTLSFFLAELTEPSEVNT